MSSNQLRHDIQGLRAIAVLSVILFHLNKSWLPGGFIGVDIFFVISGFLITGIILQKKKSQNFSLLAFYSSRAKRIIPAYLALIIALSVFATIFLTSEDFALFKQSAKSALYFNSNSFFSKQGNYFSPAAYELPLLHTWSLAIEMQFYLLLPALLILIPQRFLAPTICLATATLVAYSEFHLQSNQQQKIYFSLLARTPEFFTGSIAALIPPDRYRSIRASNFLASLGLMLILPSFFLITESSSFPGLLALPPCIGTALLLISHNSSFNRALSYTPLVFIGALSYSLYLWHWPILAIIRYLSGTYTLSALLYIAFPVLTAGCAYLSYRYIESPFRKRSSTKTTYTRLASLATASLIVLSVAGAINRHLVAPLPDNLTRYAVDAEICHGQIVGDCLRGDKSSNQTLLMLGDSHAAQLNYFADIIGNSIHAKIKVISASNCVTIPGFDTNRIAEWGRDACNAQINEAKKHIPEADGIVIAGMWQFHTPSAPFMEQLEIFISEASTRNQSILVLAQVPMFSSNPQRTYRINSMGLHLTTHKNTDWITANLKVKTLVSRHKNASFLDLSNSALFSEAPLQNNTLIYMDSHHLNEVGSVQYGAVAAPYFQTFIDHIHTLHNAATLNSSVLLPID